ncbi:UNVERIFIED_CONTAM: hypothetical protein NCL1_19863 [Trichonephila clavipes]
MVEKRNLCDVFGEEAVTAQTCQTWLLKFYLGDLSLKDEPKSERLSDVLRSGRQSIQDETHVNFYKNRLTALNSSDYFFE